MVLIGQLADVLENRGWVHIGSENDLTGAPCACQQQLTNSMTTFDLVTTKALATATTRASASTIG
jgi:hypothetical protein